MQQNTLRYRGIRLCYNITDVNNTEQLEPRALATRFTANMGLLKPELSGVVWVTPARVTLEVVGGPPQDA